MNRPKHQQFQRPKHINEYPVGPQFTAGFLAEKNAGWRTFKPVVEEELCNFCLRCYITCPDGTIFKDNGKINIDLDFCKGCGICAHECPKDAIKMIKEEI